MSTIARDQAVLTASPSAREMSEQGCCYGSLVRFKLISRRILRSSDYLDSITTSVTTATGTERNILYKQFPFPVSPTLTRGKCP